MSHKFSAPVKICLFRKAKIFDLDQHLAVHELHGSSSGPDPDPNKSTVHKNSRLGSKPEKAKGRAAF